MLGYRSSSERSSSRPRQPVKAAAASQREQGEQWRSQQQNIHRGDAKEEREHARDGAEQHQHGDNGRQKEATGQRQDAYADREHS
jgi:hypothetical protein